LGTPIIVLAFKFFINSFFINYFFIRIHVITDRRVITMTGNKIRSFLSSDFSDIIIRDNEVVYFQEFLTDPDGKRTLYEYSIPLDQDKSEIVAMLNNLKERGSSGYSTLDCSQTSVSVNPQICQVVPPPHVEEVLNCELQVGEQVVQTVIKKQNILQSPGHAFLVGFGIYLFIVAIGVSLTPSMYFMIPLILGLLVILLAIQDFRHYPETLYVMTDRRAIRICPRCWPCQTPPSIHAFPLFQPYHVFRREYSNGIGDVIFTYKWDFGETGFVHHEDGFFGILNAKDVENTLKELARQTNSP
jgi:hypothetical protein